VPPRVESPRSAPGRPDLAALPPAELTGAFEQLFEEHSGRLHAYLSRRVGSTVAEDLVAETFLIALRERCRYDPSRAAVRTWLYGIATNLLRNHVRSEVRGLRATGQRNRWADVEEAHPDRAAARVDAEVRIGQLAGALAQLSAGDRDVLLLVSWAGLSTAEVGEVLGIPAGTVRSRLHRVRNWIRANAAATHDDDLRSDHDG
jgi:RNA polymerase sigma factor (sigma-70 family)